MKSLSTTNRSAGMHLATKAQAKINLTLELVGKRADGYHDLWTVMQTLDLSDDVQLICPEKPSTDSLEANAVQLVCSHPGLDSGMDNIAYRAAVYWFEESEQSCVPITIHLQKRIPMQAGLGGGSSDAAAVLRLLQSALPSGLDVDQLNKLAARLGADVPFALVGGTALCEGIGDRITPLPSFAGYPLIVVCPPYPISTIAAFRALTDALPPEGANQRAVEERKAFLYALKVGDLTALGRYSSNVFESYVSHCHPNIAEAMDLLRALGSPFVRLTGSGSAFYGFFPDSSSRDNAMQLLRRDLPPAWTAFSTHTVDSSAVSTV